MKHALLLLALCALVTLNGCSISSSPKAAKTPAVVVIPNVGTSWTFQNTYRDSTGTVTGVDTSVRVIAAVNQTVQGFSDVVVTVETFSSTKLSDTLYIRYLSTGDISRLSWPLIAPHIAPEWLTIPYYTRPAKSSDYNWVGSFSLKGYTFDTVAFSVLYADQENDTVAGVVYAASVVNSTTWQNMTGPGKDSLFVQDQTNAFIPANGIFGSRETTLHTIDGKQVTHEQQVLIAVNVK